MRTDPGPPLAEPNLMSRLLVAVSSPWASDKLADPIADLARRLEASVHVAHVATLQETDEHESGRKPSAVSRRCSC